MNIMKKVERTKRVVIGGTFEALHEGHKALLKRAFSLGGVSIGLTSDALVKKIKKRRATSFNQRKASLESFIAKEFKTKPRIFKIEDKFGPTLEEDFDYIVVSPETYKTALLINKERLKRSKKPIRIVKIGFVLAKDKKPIASSRILNGEINKRGELLG